MKEAILKEVGRHLSSKRCSSISTCLGGLLKIDVPVVMMMTIIILTAVIMIKMMLINYEDDDHDKDGVDQ